MPTRKATSTISTGCHRWCPTGGLVLAHNDDMSPQYQRRVTANPALETRFFREGAGMAITLKKLQKRAAAIEYSQCINSLITPPSTAVPDGPSMPRRAAQ